jgi:hypothetical protein
MENLLDLNKENKVGLVKYRNLIRRMGYNIDNLQMYKVNINKLPNSIIKHKVAIELVKNNCFVVITKIQDPIDNSNVYSVEVLHRYTDNEVLEYEGKQVVKFSELRYLLSDIDFNYFNNRRVRTMEYEITIKDFTADILDEELPF